MKEQVGQPDGGLAMKVCAKARRVGWLAAAMAVVTLAESLELSRFVRGTGFGGSRGALTFSR